LERWDALRLQEETRDSRVDLGFDPLLDNTEQFLAEVCRSVHSSEFEGLESRHRACSEVLKWRTGSRHKTSITSGSRSRRDDGRERITEA
jgi:hypothetical protein